MNSPRSAAWQYALAIIGTALCALLVLYTRRIELLALLAVPLGLRMVTHFKAAVTISTCVMLVWLSRIPLVFFDLPVFTYAVYFTLAVTAAAYVLRVALASSRRLPLITTPWVWLLVAVVVAGGIHGATQVDRIPPWLLTPDNADYSTPWVYFRTVALPGVLLPMLAVFIAASVADGQRPEPLMVPITLFALVLSLMVIMAAATTGQNLVQMAQADARREHLAVLGFHSNETGTMLAVAYALVLGFHSSVRVRLHKMLLVFTLSLISIAVLLTFSRGAYLAFAVTNMLFFMRGSPARKAAFVTLAVLVWFAAPDALSDRLQYGMQSRNLNDISAGRVEHIWLPLLPDIADHIVFGQGLHSIMWTDAQRFQQIFAVGLAHNAYLDLLLDLGLLGAIPVLAWYGFLWTCARRMRREDPDPRFRALFEGAHLALVAFLLCALTNDRLTPSGTNGLLWLAGGILIGREILVRRHSAVTAVGTVRLRPTAAPLPQHGQPAIARRTGEGTT